MVRPSLAGGYVSVGCNERDQVSPRGVLAQCGGTGEFKRNGDQFADIQSASTFSSCRSSAPAATILRAALLLRALPVLRAGSLRVRLWAVGLVTAGSISKSFDHLETQPLIASTSAINLFVRTPIQK